MLYFEERDGFLNAQLSGNNQFKMKPLQRIRGDSYILREVSSSSILSYDCCFGSTGIPFPSPVPVTRKARQNAVCISCLYRYGAKSHVCYGRLRSDGRRGRWLCQRLQFRIYRDTLCFSCTVSNGTVYNRFERRAMSYGLHIRSDNADIQPL